MNRMIEKAALPLLLFLAVGLFCMDSPFTAFFLYTPLFFIMEKKSPKKGLLWGGLYGLFSYMFYLNWLFTFNSTAFLCVCSLYLLYFALVFFIGCRFFRFFGSFGAFCFVPFFIACEFIRTTGFLGFSYGVAAYSLWSCPYLIQSADLFGVWGIEFLLLYSSALLYYGIRFFCREKSAFRKKSFFSLSIGFAAIFIINLVYGIIKIEGQYGGVQSHGVSVCAVQNNSDPWSGDIDHYKADVKTLISLTDKALAIDPHVDFVVWPETSVVPSILQNFYEGKELERKKLVYELLKYIDGKNSVFVLGNYNPVGKGEDQKDYNCAFVFVPGENVFPPEPYVYAKNHLVPFAEYFPYDKEFPFINDFLFENDRQWAKGKERVVFNCREQQFSTPICFEDGFGSECAEFVRNGAKILFNLSNDAWAKSRKSQIQHLSMSVFRSIENRVPVVRSTSSGETCIIDKRGIVESCCNSFEESFALGMIVPKDDSYTWYTKMPDVLAYVFVVISIFLVAFMFISKLAIGPQIR